MNSGKLSETSGICHNHCQLGRELVSGGLLAGGLFWIAATLILFASEITGVNNASSVSQNDTWLTLLGVISAAISNIVGELPGYRMVLALAGTLMIVQSRTLVKARPWTALLIISGVIGVFLQIYNGVGTTIWVSAVFLTLIVIGLILSVVWVMGEKNNPKSPVYIDDQGRYFIKQKSHDDHAQINSNVENNPKRFSTGERKMPPGVEMGSFTSASFSSSDSEQNRASEQHADDESELRKEPLLPPMPTKILDNVTEFPSIENALSDSAIEEPLTAGEIDLEEADPTLQMEQPDFSVENNEAVEDAGVDLNEDSEAAEELEKTMILERPAFLDYEK